MESSLKIEKAEECEPSIKYRNIIGALLYVSSGTRPEISHSVNYLSRFQNCYTETLQICITNFKVFVFLFIYLFNQSTITSCLHRDIQSITDTTKLLKEVNKLPVL